QTGHNIPTNQRHAEKPKHQRFTETLKEQAHLWLTKKISPELISGRWKAGPMANTITQQRSQIPSSFVKTLTFTSAKAFATTKMSPAGWTLAPTLLAHILPHKGTGWNRIWVIWRFIPKGTDLLKISTKCYNQVEVYLNFKPAH